jgi:hypothetical protein
MEFRVVEQYARGKRGEAAGGEDRVVVTPSLAAVVDGVGTPHPFRDREGRSGGAFVAMVLADALAELDPDLTAAAAVEQLRLAVAEGLSSYGLEPSTTTPAAVLAVFSAPRMEIWRVGDVQVRVDGTVVSGRGVPPLRAVTDARSAYLHALLTTGSEVEALRSADPSRELLLPLRRVIHVFRNHPESPWGYGCLDGRPVPQHLIDVIPVRRETTRVVLASDGYPEPASTLAEAERQLHDALESDPLLVNRIRHREPLDAKLDSFDDRSYVRLDITRTRE